MPSLNAPGHNAPLPYLTASLPGIGGVFRSSPDDFIVEELPSYPPSGLGEHLYLFVEKVGLSTDAVLAHLVRQMGLPLFAAGYAGKKDTQARTRQWISLHTPQDPDPLTLEIPGLKILTISRHTNKLRLGHLAGNVFKLIVRDVAHPEAMAPLALQIQEQGFPNYFGSQRLGRGYSNVHAGQKLLEGERSPRGNLNQVRFSTNAYQSALFNRVLSLRLERTGDVTTLLTGDLAVLHRNGAHFSVTEENLSSEQERVLKGETSPSAPLFGYKVPLASGIPGALETSVLAAQGLTLEDFRLGGKRVSPKGERRAIRAMAYDFSWRRVPGVEPVLMALEFRLDRGVFATSLLREVMKNDALQDLYSNPVTPGV